jgi:hypothetical protein
VQQMVQGNLEIYSELLGGVADGDL